MIFSIFVFLVAMLAGGVAAISGFGIGSLLTLLLSVGYGIKLAVAIISVPHIIATAARFLSLHKHLDRRVFRRLARCGSAARCRITARIREDPLLRVS